MNNSKKISPKERVGSLHLSQFQRRRLAQFKHYIWWEKLPMVMKRPDRLIAQVMDIGIWEDVCSLAELVSKRVLLTVLRNAEAGQFSPRSWHYWWYYLTDIDIDEVPPMPERTFGGGNSHE